MTIRVTLSALAVAVAALGLMLLLVSLPRAAAADLDASRPSFHTWFHERPAYPATKPDQKWRSS